MKLLKHKTDNEEQVFREGTIAIGRRMFEAGYNKEFIMDTVEITELGYEEVFKRAIVMECAKQFVDYFQMQLMQKLLSLSEDEVKDLIAYKNEKRNKEKLNKCEEGF